MIINKNVKTCGRRKHLSILYLISIKIVGFKPFFYFFIIFFVYFFLHNFIIHTFCSLHPTILKSFFISLIVGGLIVVGTSSFLVIFICFFLHMFIPVIFLSPDAHNYCDKPILYRHQYRNNFLRVQYGSLSLL